MILLNRKIYQGLLAASSLVLVACGESSEGRDINRASTNTDINAVGVNSTPSSSALRNLLAQGLINDEATDLSDTARLQTDDGQDAFDL